MENNRNLLLVESEMVKAKGHFLDYLIETSNYFKINKKITWFLNRNFDSQNLYLPDFCDIRKIIISNKFKRKRNKFLYLIEEIFFFILNFYHILFFSFYFVNQINKLFLFYKCLFGNYFIVPRYFKSFYLNYVKLNFNQNDDIFFQSCRRKDVALVYFLSTIEKNNLPKIHLRVFLPPNKRFKDFYFYLKKFKNNMQQKIFLYTEDGYKKGLMSKELGDPNLVNITTPIFNFYNRSMTTKKHVIGFIGEARANKGFNKIPKLIEILNKQNKKFEFLIQFAGTDNETKSTSKILFDLSKKNANIKIINKYCDYQEYRSILKNITIMPFMYDSEHMNNTNSGIIYSCISNEIIPIIPNNCDYLKKILTDNSFLESPSLESFAKNIIEIIENYEKFLTNAKKSSLKLTNIIDNGSIVFNINN
jgi:hypothetical protein